MMSMNVVKVLALLAGVNPLLALALVSVSVAAYAPAKCGLLTELLGRCRTSMKTPACW
ncbi:MAG: hypothetical protein Q8N44_11235 [Rubrivivax sp.]|nr:hypothetical protein [Rubrivivax sp.]